MTDATRTKCMRCEVRLRVATHRNEDARILRRALTSKGLCVNCAVTEFFKTTASLERLLQGSGYEPADVLRFPHIQEQFAAVLRVGGSDAFPDEIDWDEVIANWELPFPYRLRADR